MATTFNDNTTYAGSDALGFYSTALLTGDTKSLIKLIPDVKNKIKIANLNMSGILGADGCTFNPRGSVSLGQKTLEVCDLSVELEICLKELEQSYLALTLKAGSNNDMLPPDFQNYVLDLVAKNVSKDLEFLLWQGDISASPATLCDGFLKKFLADAAVVDVTGTTLTQANVIAEIGKLYSAVNPTISNSDDLVIFVSPAAAKLYRQALAALNNGLIGSYNKGDFNLSYINIPIIVAAGMPTNQMVACETQNLFYGTDVASDCEDITILNMRNTTGDKTVRFIASFKFGVQFGNATEITFYH